MAKPSPAAGVPLIAHASQPTHHPAGWRDRVYRGRRRAAEHRRARYIRFAQLDGTKRGLALVPAGHAEPQRQAGRTRSGRLAGAGNRHGEPRHADQLPGRAGRRDPRRLRRGRSQRRSLRPPARLLAGRRRELRPRHPVRRRRARDRGRGDRRRRHKADRLSVSRRHPISDGGPPRSSETRPRRPPTIRASTPCPACRRRS